MLVEDGCSNHDDSNSKLEKYRMVENERTMRTESVNSERQRSRVRSKGQVLKWHTESRKESGNVEERDDVMQVEWNASNSSV